MSPRLCVLVKAVRRCITRKLVTSVTSFGHVCDFGFAGGISDALQGPLQGALGRGRGRGVGSVALAAARQWLRGVREEVVAPTAMAADPTSAGRDREGRG